MTEKTRDVALITGSSPTRVPTTLISGDIPRSTPARRCPAEPPKRWYDSSGKCGSLTVMDIAGAQCVNRHVMKRNKPDRIYSCSDIDGTWPDGHTHLSDRQVDPMAPRYTLPSSVQAPMPKLPPARLVGTTDGIDGATSNVAYMQLKQRKSSFLCPVEGATVPKRRLYKNRRNPLDVSDINNDPEGAGHCFRTNRQTDVLDPTYVWDVPEGAVDWRIGQMTGNKPSTLMNARDAPEVLHGKPMPSKGPIEGAACKHIHELQLSKAVHAFKFLEMERREIRNTNHVQDITGATAGSVRPGITTKRVTHPLMPEYNWPGLKPDVGSNAFCHTPDPPATPTPQLTPPRTAPTPQAPSPRKNQAELDLALTRVKQVFHERGAFAGRALARVVRNFDDGDGNINKSELRDGMQTYLGFDMVNQDFDHVWRYFDKDDSDHISVDEFLHGIRGNLNKHRLQAVEEAFEKIDRDSGGFISINELEALYDVTHHPAVVSGEWTRKEALQDFLAQWDANADGEVSKQEFVDYFKDVSLSLKHNHEFIKAMRNIFPTLAPAEISYASDDSLPASPARRRAASVTPDSTKLDSGRLARAQQRRADSVKMTDSELAAEVASVRDIRTPASASRPAYSRPPSIG